MRVFLEERSIGGFCKAGGPPQNGRGNHHFGKHFGSFKKLHLPYDLAIPFPVIYPRESKAHVHVNEAGWDLGPFAVVLAPGQTFSSRNKIQRNYKGVNLTVSWGKL